MDIVSIVLSIIAIVISITVAILEYIRDYRINYVNLEAEYYKKIFETHLIDKIPTARKYISFNYRSKLVGVDNLINALQEMQKDSLYFLYNNKNFYDKLKKRAQKLEDYLVEKANDGEISNENEQREILNSINQYIEDLYIEISKGYNGK